MCKKYFIILAILMFANSSTMQKKLIAMHKALKKTKEVKDLRLSLVAKKTTDFIKFFEEISKFYTSKKLQEKMKEFTLKDWGTNPPEWITLDQAVENWQYDTKRSISSTIQFLKDMRTLVVDKKTLIDTQKDRLDQVYQEMKTFVEDLKKIDVATLKKPYDSELDDDIEKIEDQIEYLQKKVYMLYLKETSKKNYPVHIIINNRRNILQDSFDANVSISLYKIKTKSQLNFFYISPNLLTDSLHDIFKARYFTGMLLEKIEIFTQTGTATFMDKQLDEEFYRLDLSDITQLQAIFYNFSDEPLLNIKSPLNITPEKLKKISAVPAA